MNTEVTPDNAASATPVAYRFRFIDEDGDKGEWRLLLPEDYDLLDAPFYEVEKLVPAATVAALEAEVERLQALSAAISRDCNECANQRNEANARADAAERRVAELEATLSRKDEIIRGLVSSPARSDPRSQGGHSGYQGDEPWTYGKFGSGE